MSIKDFFYKKEVVLEDQSKLTSSVESADLIEEIREQNKTFVPDVDFSDPKNFARFGSAKEYYEGSIKRIYEQYPYDGSEAEKLSFYNDSTFLDQWLFDNKYPKSTGYAIFSAGGWGTGTTITDYGKPNNLEYIYSAGGLREASLYQHTGSDTISSGQLKNVFDKGIKHDSDKNRTLNYRMKMDDGLTIQFWMKKDEFLPSSTKREVILDLWNGVTTSGSHDYGRLILEMSASDKQESTLRLTLYSGSYGIVDQPIALSSYGSASIANGEWQHHTITVKAASQNLEINYYNNGILNSGSIYGTTNTLGEIPNNINGYLGALQTASYGDDYHNQDMVGAGKLSASLDDFRYWKKELDAQYIKNTWFYPIGGGSNSDDNRTSLGVYYKFNEGVVGNTAYDATVLDYSGRIANGTWTGYTTSSRNTGSAYVSASILQSEPGDPIIRLDHPSVQSLLTEMATSGSNHDRDNTIRMYDMVPAWLREEDTNGNINYLFQILSSYFDTLYCQIKEVPKLKDKNYFDSGNMPYEFIDRMLSEKGLLVPNTFVSSEILNTFWQRDNQNNYFEQSIEKTKRQIYYNIYNNLEFILKSKGTEKSFRNLLRCFGIDDEVIKLNVYTDNATHYLKDRYKNSSVKSKFVNFNKPSRFGASITQTSSSINSLTFISGSDTARLERNNAFTIEGDVLFPEPRKVEDNDYFVASFISSSIFGFHEANSSDSTDYTFGGSNDANLQFYAVKEEVGSTSVKFVVKNADDSIVVESDLFEEVYTNERWNFSLTVEPVGYPFAGSFLSSSNPDYNIRLYGVTYNNEEIKNEFTLTASVSNTIGNSLLTKPKRLYVGANKTNFTGSTIASTDVKIGSIRMWMDKLSNEAIQQHNLDPKNYGHNKIYGSPTVFFHDISGSSQIPAMDSLILHWNFDENASSDASGEFIVEDFSSGSTSSLYGWASNIIERENKGLGLDFPASEEVFTNEFIFARRKELPEISFTDDRITIMDDEKEFFIEDEDTTDNIFSLEKSMNQSISEEMIRTFSTMKEYANLFAKPVDYYRQDYKRLRKARSLFFERTTGNPDFDKFTEYFKWIDTSVSFFIEQLKPASVTFNEGIANVVESHIFERPKNERKFPTVKTLQSTMGSLRGIGELDYNWKFGHAPDYKSSTDDIHCLWKKEREVREDIADRETIRKILGSKTSGIIKRLGDPTTNPQTAYIAQGYAEATRRFSKPYKLTAEASTTIHGGTNYNENRNRDFIFDNIKPHGSKTSTGIPVNVVVVGVGPGQGIINSSVCDDIEDPNKKEKYNFRMTVGKDSSGDGSQPSTGSLDLVYEVKSAYGSPFNIVSGNVDDGTNRTVDQNYKDSVILTNLHSDTTYISNDVPMQGPFTETWVGGRQNRHVQLNKYNEDYTTTNKLDDQYTRPEAYRILFGEHPDESVQDGALGIVGPDYGGPYPDTTRKWAIYYRDLRGKRPYNIQNIQGDQYRQGNYTEKYEYFNSVGRSENNLRFKKQADTWDFLAEEVKNELPETTNQIGLFAVEPSNDGNIASGFDSNRHNAISDAVFGNFSIALPDQYSPPTSEFIGITASINEVSTETQIEITTADIAIDSETDISSSLFSEFRNRFFALGNFVNSFLLQGAGNTINGLSGSFSFSFFYEAETNTTSFNRFDINEGSNLRLYVYHDVGSSDQWNVGFRDTSGNNEDLFVFQGGYTQANTIHHIVFVIDEDMANVSPKLYIDGDEISLTTTPPSTHPALNIDEIHSIRFSDNSFLQDLVFWEKKLTQEDINSLVEFKQIYAGWSWKDPSTHVSASYINNWWKIGYEDYLDDILTVGDNLKDHSSNITISSSYSGTGNGIDLNLLANNANYNTLYTTGGVGTVRSELEILSDVQQKMLNRFTDYTSNTSSAGWSAYNPFTMTFTFGTQYYVEMTSSTAGTNIISLNPTVMDFAAGGNISNNGTPNTLFRNIVQVESDFITGSTRNRTIITSRFSAPGGVEVQTYGYLDAYAHEYSVHNNLNYRNLSIRGSGSGESGTIRVNSHANTRDGLRTLYQRPMGRGGVDSVYEQLDETDYNLTASFHKVPRNTLVRPKSSPTKAVNLSGSSVLTQESKLINYSLTGYSSSGAISFSGWMKLISFNGHLFAFQDSATDYPYDFSYQAYNAISGIYIFMYSTTGLMNFYSWNNADLGVTNDYWLDWHHYVISWDGNLSSAPILYLNGQTGVTANSVVVNGGTRKDFDKIQIGSSQQLPYYDNNNANYQDLVFFSSTINLAQAQELYNNGKRFDVTKHSLKANIIDYWNLTNEYQDIVEPGEDFGENLEFSPKIGSNILSSVGKIYEQDPVQGSFVISTKNLKNNLNYQSTIPASDYNYSWVTSSLGDNYNVRSGTQKVFGYWPKDGLNKVNGVIDTAITFPSSSTEYIYL